MNLKEIYEHLVVLAQQNMTESKIHHDDWPNLEHEYVDTLLDELRKMNE